MTLRPWRDSDVPAMVEACQDPEISRWTRVPSPYTEDDALHFMAHGVRGDEGEIHLAIVDPESDELLGSIGLMPKQQGVAEIGYWVGSEVRGRGIAARAVRLLARWGLEERGLARIQIHTDPANAASQRVAERAGFTREGVLRSYEEFKGEHMDVVMFSLLPGEL